MPGVDLTPIDASGQAVYVTLEPLIGVNLLSLIRRLLPCRGRLGGKPRYRRSL
jgi:hypothetical protein